MLEQVSPCPAIHPRQYAHKTFSSSSVMIHRGKVGSFIFWEWRTFAKTTCLSAMISPWTLFTNPETNWLHAWRLLKALFFFLCVVAGFKNKMWNEVSRLGWRKTFGIAILAWNSKRIDSNARLHVPFLYLTIKRIRIFRQLGSVIFLLTHLL